MKSHILRTLALLWIILFTALLAQAYNQADVNRLFSTNKCPGGDLRQADLRPHDLTGADLTGADLSYSIVQYMEMAKAELEGANMYYAVMQH
ncbi:MAG: pentapeptide repeat-containing protein, partial [bacterium]